MRTRDWFFRVARGVRTTLRSGVSWHGCAVGVGVLTCLAACSPYTLRGKVIEGDISYVAVVDANDPRLAGAGIGNASLELISNPERLNHKMLAGGITDPAGSFDLHVDEAGAGILTYDTSLTVRHDGHTTASNIFKLPPDSKRVLVSLKRGPAGKGAPSDSLMEEMRRYRP